MFMGCLFLDPSQDTGSYSAWIYLYDTVYRIKIFEKSICTHLAWLKIIFHTVLKAFAF